MSRFWKVLVGLAIVLPMAAYVAGSVTASSGDDPVRRDPVYIMDVPETPESEKPRRGIDPSPPETQAPVDGQNDDDDDADDNGVRVVTPQPTRVDGDDADDRPEGDDDDSRDGGDDSDDGEGD